MPQLAAFRVKFDYPPNEPALIVSRSFDAPASLVWTAFTDPAFVARWWSPRSIARTIKVEKLDLRPGGEWRFVCTNRNLGDDSVFFGKYLEVEPNKKLVIAFGVEGVVDVNEDYPEQHYFEERDGRTYYRSYTLLPSIERRDAIRSQDMELGTLESMNQLGEVVDELVSARVH
jgi:uncharacterized protein YndB with AHSA1/START domain